VSFTLEAEVKSVAHAVAVERPVTVTKPGTHSRFLWVDWAATGALTAGAVVLGVLGASEASSLEHERTSLGATTSSLNALHGRAQGYLIAADVVGGAALLAGGLSLYVQLSSSSAEHRAGGSALKLGISPTHVDLGATF
jgi:hypothetical protein